jgi:hypothetical protein
VRFFLEGHQRLEDVHLALKMGVAFEQFRVALVLRVQLRLATGLAGLQRADLSRSELRSPVRQQGAVDALLTHHGFERTTLAARQAGVRSLHDSQFLGRRELTTRSTRHRLYGAATCTASTLTLLALPGFFFLSNRHRFRHDRRSSLRPWVHTFPGDPVSRDVGTGGGHRGGDLYSIVLMRDPLRATSARIRREGLCLVGRTTWASGQGSSVILVVGVVVTLRWPPRRAHGTRRATRSLVASEELLRHGVALNLVGVLEREDGKGVASAATPRRRRVRRRRSRIRARRRPGS